MHSSSWSHVMSPHIHPLATLLTCAPPRVRTLHFQGCLYQNHSTAVACHKQSVVSLPDLGQQLPPYTYQGLPLQFFIVTCPQDHTRPTNVTHNTNDTRNTKLTGKQPQWPQRSSKGDPVYLPIYKQYLLPQTDFPISHINNTNCKGVLE